MKSVFLTIFILVISSCQESPPRPNTPSSTTRTRVDSVLEELMRDNRSLSIFDSSIIFKDIVDKYDQIKLFLVYDNLAKVYVVTKDPKPHLDALRFSKDQTEKDFRAPLPDTRDSSYLIFAKRGDQFDVFLLEKETNVRGKDSSIRAEVFDDYVAAKTNGYWKTFFPDGYKKQLDGHYDFLRE